MWENYEFYPRNEFQPKVDEEIRRIESVYQVAQDT